MIIIIIKFTRTLDFVGGKNASADYIPRQYGVHVYQAVRLGGCLRECEEMARTVYAWLCVLVAAFGGFMWGYEVG